MRIQILSSQLNFLVAFTLALALAFSLLSCGPSKESSKTTTTNQDTTKNEPGVLQLEGHYQGQNLYFQNPYFPQKRPCAYKITLNGKPFMDSASLASSAVQIDLKGAGLEMGEEVILRIYHHNDCMPKILNPEVR